jgi:hypothetical protein
MPPKKKQTDTEKLIYNAHAANEAATTARKKWQAESARKALPTKEIEELEQAYREATSIAVSTRKMATEAAIAQRKINEEAEEKAARKRIKENKERNAKEAGKTTKPVDATYIKGEALEAFEKEFLAKEAERKATQASRKALGQAKLNAQREANETRRRRINNIKGKTNIKRKNVEALVKNINAMGIDFNSESIAHIISIAAKAKVAIEDVLMLIESSLVYDTQENAISFLSSVAHLELDLETFLEELEIKKIPFAELTDLLEHMTNNNLSEAETAYVLKLAHTASVPADIATDMYHTEPVRKPFTMQKRLRLMRLAYLTELSIHDLVHPRNSREKDDMIKNAEQRLYELEKEKKPFSEFMEQQKKALQNLKNKERAKSTIVNRSRFINMLNNNSNNNSGRRTKKVERGTYKSVAARRIEEVKGTYTGLKVNHLPIEDILIRTKKDIQDIADVLRGCFRGGIFGKKKGTPEIKTIYIPIDKATKKPKGYAFVEYQTHEAAKEALDYMKNPDTKKPTYGKTGHEIMGKDVAPAYGEEYFKYAREDD